MTHNIEIGGHTVTVDVAKDAVSRYVGLSEKEDLGVNEGMLFVWPVEKEHGLVMRDMDFGIDMVFADADGNVTKVHSTGPDGEGARALSKYAVELPRGWCQKGPIEKGDTLELNDERLGKSDTPTEADTKTEIAAEFFERADMDMSMFAALADETPDPTVESVAADYNEIEGKTPDGDTQTATKSEILDAVDSVFEKDWIPYVGPDGGEGWQSTSDPEDVRYQTDPPGEPHGEYGADYWERHGTEGHPRDEPLTEYLDEIPDAEITDGTADGFANSVEKFQGENPEKGAFLSYHPPEEMQDHEIMKIEEEGIEAGAAVSPEGDLQNLHKFEGPQGVGRNLVEEGIDRGGRTADCYAGYLNRVYRQHGFREVARQEFNPEFAPDGWNEEKYEQPDVVFMAYMPDKEPERTDRYIDDWGQAKDLTREKANWQDRMAEDETEEKQTEIRIPEDRESAIEMVQEDEDEELSEQQKNVIQAQAELIGDI